MGYYLSVSVHFAYMYQGETKMYIYRGKGKLVVAATYHMFPWQKGWYVLIHYPKSRSHSQRGNKAEMGEERAYICKAMSCKVIRETYGSS